VNPAKLVFCNVPARDASSLVPFYSTLIGSAFVQNTGSPIPQYQEAITGDGVDMTLTQRNDTREVTTTYWSVDDIRGAISDLQNAGAQVVQEPAEMPDGSYNAILLDPEGNYVGLVQFRPEDTQQYFRIGKFFDEFADQLQRRREELRSSAKAA